MNLYSIYFLFFFFFSSRRRHTRFDCDWSSDVCSSDLFRSVSSLLLLKSDEAYEANEHAAEEDEPRKRVLRRRSEEHTSELQSQSNLVCRLLLEKKKNDKITLIVCLTFLQISLSLTTDS